MTKLTQKIYTELLKSDETYLLLFSADWCGSCKMLKPSLEKVAKEKGLEIYTYMVDEDNSLSNSLGVMSLPTVIKFKGDKEISRFTGNHTQKKLQELI